MFNMVRTRSLLRRAKIFANIMPKPETNKINSDHDISNKLDYAKLDSFHKAVGPVLFLAQCFALMPVSGITNPDPHYLKFHWKSFRMLVTVLFIIASCLLTLAFIRRLSELGVNAKNIVGIVFFSCGIITCFLFLFLAQRWSSLIITWTKIEMVFLKPPYKPPQMKLAVTIRLAAIIILLLAMLEHAMYLSSNVYEFVTVAKICNVSYNASFKEYFINNYPHVFEKVPYHFVLAVIIWVLNLAFTFIWNYMDLFIMLISLGLALRFKQINVRILNLKGKEIPEEIWTEIRIDFVNLCELLEIVDNNLSAIILLSCSNNLYFICYQLLNIFNKLRWTIHYIYFWYSLLYLIGRTACIFLCAASINDESKKPLVTLRSVPSTIWCSEIERFIEQVTTQSVALSGMKFFFLTRKLLFGMAGTIVTYELVLLQFDEANRSKGLPPLCRN